MARPKKDIQDLKSIRLNVRITLNEFLDVSDGAKTLGITIPDYVRRKVSGRVLPRKKILPEDRKLFVELSRIGNNINQLTKNAHLGMNDPYNLQGQLHELKNVLGILKNKIIGNDRKTN